MNLQAHFKIPFIIDCNQISVAPQNIVLISIGVWKSWKPYNCTIEKMSEGYVASRDSRWQISKDLTCNRGRPIYA